MKALPFFILWVACCSAFSPAPPMHLRRLSRISQTLASKPSAVRLTGPVCSTCESLLNLEFWFLVGYVLGPVLRRFLRQILDFTNSMIDDSET